MTPRRDDDDEDYCAYGDCGCCDRMDCPAESCEGCGGIYHKDDLNSSGLCPECQECEGE